MSKRKLFYGMMFLVAFVLVLPRWIFPGGLYHLSFEIRKVLDDSHVICRLRKLPTVVQTKATGYSVSV